MMNRKESIEIAERALGEKLILGDCLIAMKDIPDGSIDMVLTDPPYGTTACKWDSVIPLEPMWEQLKRVIKPNGAIALFGSEPFSSALRMSNIKNFRYDIIWEKERPTNIFYMKKQIGKVHEIISIFYNKQPIYNPQMEKRSGKHSKKEADYNLLNCNNNRTLTHKHPKYKYSKTYEPTLVYPRSVLKINRDRLKNMHPTQKPVALMEYLIKTYTNEGEKVLDFTMGSGTTGVACRNLNRNFIGIEKDKEYFDIANERITNE